MYSKGIKAWGYAVSTVGFEEAEIRAYIQNQEQLDSKGYDEKGNLGGGFLAALGATNNRQAPLLRRSVLVGICRVPLK